MTIVSLMENKGSKSVTFFYFTATISIFYKLTILFNYHHINPDHKFVSFKEGKL